MNLKEGIIFLAKRSIELFQEHEALIAPLIPPGMSICERRRMAARLRAGAIRPIVPQISPQKLAEIIEWSVWFEVITLLTLVDLRKVYEDIQLMEERYKEEQKRRDLEGFHCMKKLAAAEVDSTVAEMVRCFHRQRRKELGRPRKRKKKASLRERAAVDGRDQP